MTLALTVRLVDKPYRRFVERSELAQAAAAALAEERLRQGSAVALLRRAAAAVDLGSDEALITGYLMAILGLPLAITCICLRPAEASGQHAERATQPPWVRLQLVY